MKKIILSLFTATFLLSCGSKTTHPSLRTTTNLHWRNINWDAKPDSNFTISKDSADMRTYYRKGENLCVGEIPMDSVRYDFYKNELVKITLYYDSKYSKELTEYANLVYGKDTSIARFDGGNLLYDNMRSGPFSHEEMFYAYMSATTGQFSEVNGYTFINDGHYKQGTAMYINNSVQCQYYKYESDKTYKAEQLADSLHKEDLKKQLKNCPIN